MWIAIIVGIIVLGMIGRAMSGPSANYERPSSSKRNEKIINRNKETWNQLIDNTSTNNARAMSLFVEKMFLRDRIDPRKFVNNLNYYVKNPNTDRSHITPSITKIQDSWWVRLDEYIVAAYPDVIVWYYTLDQRKMSQLNEELHRDSEHIGETGDPILDQISHVSLLLGKYRSDTGAELECISN